MLWVLNLILMVGPYDGGRPYAAAVKVPGLHSFAECNVLLAQMQARGPVMYGDCRPDKDN